LKKLKSESPLQAKISNNLYKQKNKSGTKLFEAKLKANNNGYYLKKRKTVTENVMQGFYT
jgi:hypothetical protein